ncbi:CPBP family glutamic-type intramembrane protease [Rickettsia tamurae]|uniref:CPBP family glutamic-type intramembrane protease n=1 Tax=Rickettsia tamurae TaxID=334545 RepID=UPI00050A15D8|nr:CPBP family intramembrane glutamic endopeptidase [Rickettsia tamurae]
MSLEKQESSGTVKYTLLSLLLCIIIIMVLSLISGYVLFEPKTPSTLPIWAINNFFLVCMAKEVFFRGFLQRILQNLLPKQQILAFIVASLIFGVNTIFKAG